MNYNEFLLEIQRLVQEKQGGGFDIKVQRVIKNNDTMLDGLAICKQEEVFAPTIYLNSYFEDLKKGMEMQDIVSHIIGAYQQNDNISLSSVKELVDFRNIKNRVVYKLINKETNMELLKGIPYLEFLDLAIVFYLIIEENNNGQMTALIHNEHMISWKTTTEELYQLAKQNSPELLPAQIKTMREVMEEMLKQNVGDICDGGLVDELLGEERVPLYVLSNSRQVNGDSCILYDNCLKKFAAEQGADIIILPSSVHEMLLMPERESVSYEELSAMVTEINQNEVSEEDRLSNQIYRYSLSSEKVEIAFRSEKYLIGGV
ncbi:DUF5688 family protein [Lacrimispora sp.]|uniref:DUF5688 family protein n=1 Tax=Lacrimispora sp. TaxID=2719234 RepID=UPI0029E7AA99|nr:hypothetical protein [Lacrimispora sp.]